ncbi:hypothetical protein LZ30DRAFT_688738 [Colletotrichum cereale]|nr:hypothetical protein LZ30DRAFT_688738 [Colletotrichum cereale]
MMVLYSLVALLGFAAAICAGFAHPRMLDADDVIVLSRDGNPRVMKDAAYEALERAAAVAPAPAPAPLSLRGATSTSGIARRGCEQSSEVQILSNASFLDWDVAISPVVSAIGVNKTQVSIGDGYSISNQLKIKGKAKLGSKDIIRQSLELAYDVKWKTSQENTYRYTMLGHMYGVIISQPRVNRLEGAVLSGCTNNFDVEPFEFNSYTSQSFGQLHWVSGVIRLCVNETYPIPFCNGEGFHR